jgi:hypothetical protein
MKKSCTIGLIAVSLTGCSHSWVKPGATQDHFEVENSACRIKATELYPPRLEERQVTEMDNMATLMGSSGAVCSGTGMYARCVTPPGSNVPVYTTRTATVDVNRPARDKQRIDCLKQNGWTYK